MFPLLLLALPWLDVPPSASQDNDPIVRYMEALGRGVSVPQGGGKVFVS